MVEKFTIPRLLALRKVTRAMEEHLHGLIQQYVSTLAPLLRPTNVLGEYVQGSSKHSLRGADKAFRDLQALYESLASSKTFNLSPGLQAPIEIRSSAPELWPMEYTHNAVADGETKSVTVVSPLRWILTYSGFGPAKLKEMIKDRSASLSELSAFVLHFLVMHIVTARQSGLTQLLEHLHFPLTTERIAEFGDLPVTCVSAAISTIRPPDDVVIQSTEIAGTTIFEEVVHLQDIDRIEDALKSQLTELAHKHNERV